MQATSVFVFATTFLLAASVAAPSVAQNYSDGSEPVAGETTRGALDRSPDPEARSLPGFSADLSSSRDLSLDPEAIKRSFTLIGRSRDGSEVRLEPGEEVIRAIEGEQGGSLDAAPEDEESDRAVIGSDDRVRVADSRTYPFSAVGYLQMLDQQQQRWRCTASLIGPRTLLTTAHCLYQHGEGGGWHDDFTFWPALNSAEEAPFGAYEYEVAYVFSAYIEEFDAREGYDSVWPYDYGIIQLSEPAGESAGWLGFRHLPGLGNFDGNLVAYQSDKEEFSMWRSVCHVPVEDVGDYLFVHGCDASPGFGSAGAPIYVLDRSSGNRHVVGMHIGDDGGVNWALRLHRPIAEWILAIQDQ